MHKLIDTLQYRTLSLIDNFGYRTVNKIVSYKVDFHILEAVYRNYYKDRILTRLVKLVKSDFDSLKKQLGLVAKIDRVDAARLTLDKIVSNSIYIIGVLTKYKSAKALSEACSMPSLQVPSHIVQIVNDINCHKRPRRIIGSNSILNCDSLKINFDTSTFSERDDSYVYFALIELNEIFKTLGFDNIMEIDDYEKLFNNHSNDFCFNTRIGRDNNDNPISLEIFLGEGFEKVDVVSAILTMPRLYDMENEKLRSVSFNLTARDYLDVVRYGKVTDIVDDDTYGLEKEIMVSKVSNVLSNTSNITTNLTRLDNGSKFNEDPDIDSTGGGSTKGPKKPDTGPDKPLGGESNIEKPQETGVKSSDRSGSTTDMGAAEGGTETDMKVQPKAAGKSNRSRGAKGKS